MTSLLGPGPYSDPTGHRVAELMVKYAAPASVLSGAVADVASRPGLRASYADDNRQYPLHTRAAAWVSAAAYHDTGSTCAKAAAAIIGALRWHDVGDEWARLAEDGRVETEKRAAHLEPKEYALSRPNRYPLGNLRDVHDAARYFLDYGDSFSTTDRRKYAAAVIKAAIAHRTYDRFEDGAVIELESGAGLGRLSRSWRDQYTVRAKLAADTVRGDYKLIPVLTNALRKPPIDPDAASVELRALDKLAGWNLPRATLIDITPTIATRKLARAVETVTGKWYDRAAVKAAAASYVPEHVLRDVCGMSGSLPLVNGEAVYEILVGGPRKAAQVIEQILEDNGVRPISTTFDRPDWTALAG